MRDMTSLLGHVILLVSSIVFKFMFYLIFKSTLLFYNLIMGMAQNQSN
jgi:hypothetical protein